MMRKWTTAGPPDGGRDQPRTLSPSRSVNSARNTPHGSSPNARRVGESNDHRRDVASVRPSASRSFSWMLRPLLLTAEFDAPHAE